MIKRKEGAGEQTNMSVLGKRDLKVGTCACLEIQT